MKKNPWSFAIDYDKAIAEDLARLAEIERLLALGIYRTVPAGYYETLVDRAVRDAKAASKLGLTLADREALAGYAEIEMESGTAIDYALLPKGWFAAGEATAKRLAAIWSGNLPAEAELKKMRSKAKSDLARHRRNKDKYGS